MNLLDFGVSSNKSQIVSETNWRALQSFVLKILIRFYPGRWRRWTFSRELCACGSGSGTEPLCRCFRSLDVFWYELIWIETFRTWGKSCSVGKSLWDFSGCAATDRGRSQQCTSQDKLCLFATWLEVQFPPSKNVANGHWNESIFHRLSNVPRFSRFSLKIPCILKHRGSELTLSLTCRGRKQHLTQVVAPVGFTFQRTCGYWVLSRAGSAHQGLPPGGLNDLPLKLAYLILKRHWRDEHFFQVKRCEIPIPAIHWRLFVLCQMAYVAILGADLTPQKSAMYKADKLIVLLPCFPRFKGKQSRQLWMVRPGSLCLADPQQSNIARCYQSWEMSHDLRGHWSQWKHQWPHSLDVIGSRARTCHQGAFILELDRFRHLWVHTSGGFDSSCAVVVHV